MNKYVSDYSNEVVKLIRELMTTIIKGKLEKEYGPDWFSLLKKNMLENQNTEGNRGKYVDPLSLKDYKQLDPTVCFHIITGDNELKEVFNFKGELLAKIIGLKNARNGIAHSRDDGTLNWQHIYIGLNAVDEARNALGKYCRDEFFNDSINRNFKSEIDKLTQGINDITSGNVKNNNIKHKRTIFVSIAIIAVLLVGIAFALTSNLRKENNNSSSSTKSQEAVNTNSINNSETKSDGDATINKENVQNKNTTLNFENNPPTQKVTNNFAISIDKVEFNRNDTTVYVNYNNSYNGDAAFSTVRLDVGDNTYQLEWTSGAANLDKILANKQGQIAIKFPKSEYTEGKSIKFAAKLMHSGSLEAREVSNKSVDIQIQ